MITMCLKYIFFLKSSHVQHAHRRTLHGFKFELVAKEGESWYETGQIGIFFTETPKTSSGVCVAIVFGRQGAKLPPVLLVW